MKFIIEFIIILVLFLGFIKLAKNLIGGKETKYEWRRKK